MKKIMPFLLPLAILLFSFVLRLSLISKGPYHVDCLNLAIQSQKTLDTGVLHHLFGSGYPLTVLCGALFIFLGRLFLITDPVIMVNFMSIVFSSLSVWLLYLICQKKFSATTGFFAAMLYSLTPIFLGISVYGKSHTPSIFFLLISVFFLFRFRAQNRFKDFLLAAVTLGLMGACRLQDIVLLLPAITFLLFTIPRVQKQKISQILLFLFIAGLVCASFHLPFLLSMHSTMFKGQFMNFWDMGVTHSLRGIFSPSLMIAFKYFLETMTAIGLLTCILGLFFIWKKDRALCLFFMLWFTVPLLFYGNLWTIAPRYFAFCLIPLFIAQGYLFSVLLRYNTYFKISVIVLSLFIAYVSLCWSYPPLLFRHKNALLPEYARWVKQTVEEDALIIIGSDQSHFMHYYGGLDTLGKPTGQFFIPKEALLTFRKKLDTLLEKGTPVYISFNGIHVYDPQQQFASLLRDHYQLKTMGGRLIEFWHKDSFRPIIYYDTLFRILKK